MNTSKPESPAAVIPVREGDAVTVRFGDPSPFGEAEMAFAGDGVLAFDPAAPDRLLTVSTSELDAAPTTLSAVFGEVGAAELIRWHIDGDPATSVQVAPTTRLAPLARLALVSWLEQWSPLDIPREAALADVGVAARLAGNPLLALRSFDQSATFVIALAERALDAELPVAIRDAILVVLESATASLGPSHEESARLGALEERYRVAEALSAQRLAQRFEDLLDAEVVVTAAAPRGLDTELGTLFSVDWALVPNRVFRSTEGQGHLIPTSDGLSVVVEPARWLDVTETFGLRVRLLNPTTGAPMAATPLRWDTQSQRFTGFFRYDTWREVVDPDSLAEGLPEVFAELPDGTQPRPRIGDSRTAAYAWREAVWALVRHRRSRAAALVFGDHLEAEDTQADRAARRAESALQPLGERASQTIESLRAWRAAQKQGSSPDSAWPSGLPVPDSVGVDRPLLSEMIEVAAPVLWPA